MSSDLTQRAFPSELPRCAHCGDVVGVYEPHRLVMDDEPGSAAADPRDAGRVLATYHSACYEAYSSQ